MTATVEERTVFYLNDSEREAQRWLLWDECGARASRCQKCGLAETRRNVVFGEGDPRSSLMFVGEGPGEEEDETGRPFVGRAGRLLTQILAAAGIHREQVYIANIVKCRPPGNRNPSVDEMAACDDYLQTQILLIRPRILVSLGAVPMQWILKTTKKVSDLRGHWFKWRDIAVMPMYHPSYLLRNPNDKKPGSPKHKTWLDIQEIKKRWELVKETGELGDIKYE